LEFYVACDRSGYQDLLFIRDFDREGKQASAAANNARCGRQAARGNWPKMMNGEIRSGHSFVKLKPSENGKGSGPYRSGKRRRRRGPLPGSVSTRCELRGECLPLRALSRRVRGRETLRKEPRRKLCARLELDPIRFRSSAVTSVGWFDNDRRAVSQHFRDAGGNLGRVIAHADDRVCPNL